jgi:hypothetical protein
VLIEGSVTAPSSWLRSSLSDAGVLDFCIWQWLLPFYIIRELQDLCHFQTLSPGKHRSLNLVVNFPHITGDILIHYLRMERFRPWQLIALLHGLWTKRHLSFAITGRVIASLM